MSDELRDALHASLERRIRRPQPNLAEVVRRGRRKRIAIIAGAALAVTTLAGGGAYLASAVVRGERASTPPAGADDAARPPGCPASSGGGRTEWTSPTVLVARGFVEGDAWVFCARTAADEERGAKALCTNWQFRTPLSSGMNCAFSFKRNGKPVELGRDHFSAVSGPVEGYFFGTVPGAAVSIELVTGDGRTFPGTVHPAPRKLGVPFQLFTLFAEPFVEGTLVARDRAGDVIRERRMEHDISPLTVERTGPGTVVGYRTELLHIYEECSRTSSSCREPRPTWIDCGDECAAALAGAAITLIAEPAHGARFTGWGGACAGAEPECELVVDRAMEVEATFEEVP